MNESVANCDSKVFLQSVWIKYSDLDWAAVKDVKLLFLGHFWSFFSNIFNVFVHTGLSVSKETV